MRVDFAEQYFLDHDFVWAVGDREWNRGIHSDAEQYAGATIGVADDRGSDVQCDAGGGGVHLQLESDDGDGSGGRGLGVDPGEHDLFLDGDFE